MVFFIRNWIDNSGEREDFNLSFLHRSFLLSKFSWSVKFHFLGKHIRLLKRSGRFSSSFPFYQLEWCFKLNVNCWYASQFPHRTSLMVLPTHLIVSFSQSISFSCTFKSTRENRILILVEAFGLCYLKITIDVELLQPFKPQQSRSNIWTEVGNVKCHVDLEIVLDTVSKHRTVFQLV